MKKKNIIFIIISIILLIGIVIFAINIKQKEIRIDNTKFDKEYDTLKNASNQFNLKRKEINENVFTDVVFTDVVSKYEEYLNEFNQYELILTELKNNTKYLNKICLKDNIQFSSMIKKCKTYKVVYEKINNLFFDDVNMFNAEIIEKSNDLNNKQKLNFYASKTINKYIDYNNDKIYEGKNYGK